MSEFSEPMSGPPPVVRVESVPGRQRWWGDFIFDRNPCLLLSTVLMLLGCYLVNSTINMREGMASDHVKLVSLIGVINVYEACIIPLGLVLIRRGGRDVARDGMWLLMFEAFFLVNGTFLNAEPSPQWGWTLNFVLLGLAWIKGAIIFRGLGLRLGLRNYGFLVLQLGIAYGLPVFLREVAVDGVVPERLMYLAYWAVGMLPVAYDLVSRAMAGGDGRHVVVRRAYVMVPWVLLVAQLGFSHWAYHSTFAMADVGPLLLGVTVAASRVAMSLMMRTWCYCLPFVACVFAASAPEALTWGAAGGWVPALSPMLVTICGMLVTYAYLISVWTAVGMMATLFFFGACYAFRAAIGEAIDGALRAIFAAGRGTRAMMPESQVAWGIVAIVTAFVLLAAGARMSLRRMRGRDG